MFYNDLKTKLGGEIFKETEKNEVIKSLIFKLKNII